jgi:uncharacterized membrane protein YkoI
VRFKRFIFISLGWAAANGAWAGDDSKTVALSDAPAAVQKTIQAQKGDGTLGEIDQVTDDGETFYDVELTAKDGNEHDFTVDADGTLSSVEVTLADAPAPVQKTIKTLAAGDGLEGIDKNMDDSEVTYDVEVMTNGQEKDFTLADDGTLLSSEVALNETPDAVQKTIQTRVGDGKLESVDKNFDDDGITYDVEMTTKAGREKDFTVAADGTLSSVRVTLAETPPAVRRTIKDRVGNGNILEIDKSFAKERGAFHYEIEDRKNGRPFDFSVGPRGRFLGMDD